MIPVKEGLPRAVVYRDNDGIRRGFIYGESSPVSEFAKDILKETSISCKTALKKWLYDSAISICNLLGGLCFIVGAIGIIGMIADMDGKMGCKKYVIGSILIYIGIKCFIIIIS